MEQPDAAECHGNAVLVAGVDDLLIADGAAGLHDAPCDHPRTAGAGYQAAVPSFRVPPKIS